MDDALALRDRTIVCISSIDWDFLWQGHQEIMSRLAGSNRVIYVENTGVRTVRPSDIGRIVRRAVRLARPARLSATPGGVGLAIISPLLLPFPRSKIAIALNERLLIPRLAGQLGKLGARDPVIFTFLPTPNAMRLVELLRTERSVVVYYCIADFGELSDLGSRLVRSERDLVRAADLVFVQSTSFAERFASLNPRIHEFQFGVNLEVFDAGTPASPELARLPRPLIGYSGGLHRHVDLGLLALLARHFSQGSIVLVGPLQEAPSALRDLPNIHFLGRRPFHELPSLIAAFDIAIVPYVRTTYTDTVFPTKLFEYLAMGKPVVSADLPEVRKLRLPSFAVRLARDAEEFIAAVNDQLADPDPDLVARRTRLAAERDWRTIVRRMARLIAERAT